MANNKTLITKVDFLKISTQQNNSINPTINDITKQNQPRQHQNRNTPTSGA
jgi:hypothetical protein